jgi:hypothetical protein
MLWNNKFTTKLNRGYALSFNDQLWRNAGSNFGEMQVVTLEHTSNFETNSVRHTLK